ncbi:MAG: hypothetical protein V4597_11630 [Pseudomonadota bacterium]
MRSPITGVVTAHSGVTLTARILGVTGLPITRASLTSVSWTVTDTVTGLAVVGGTGAPTVASCVTDALQQSDPRWTKDSAQAPGDDGRWGYNFLLTLPASLFVVQTRYQADVVFTPVTGEPFRVAFLWTPVRVFG